MNGNSYQRGFGRFFRPPRSESVHITDGKGGLIRDGLLILYQSVSIVLLTVVLVLGTLLYLWTFPAWAWWCAIMSVYCTPLVLLPIIAWIGICPFQNIGIRTQRLISMVLTGWIFAALIIFYQFLWDWAENWTKGFFDFQVPVISGWILAALLASGLFLLSSLLLQVLVKPATILSGIALVAAGVCWAMAVLTIEWADPGLMYYVTTGGLLAALWTGIPPAISRLRDEVSDRYTPYGSESDGGRELAQRKLKLDESKLSLDEEKFAEKRAKEQQRPKGGKAQPSTDVHGPRKEEGLKKEEVMKALEKSWEETLKDGEISEGELIQNMELEIEKIKRRDHHGTSAATVRTLGQDTI